MNKILSYVRRCVEDYDMIQAGDRVAVGVSGGKDSLTLLVALARLREFYPKPFTVEAYTLDMGHVDGGEGMDFTGVEALCRELDVPFTLLHSEIHHIIFDLRKEKNPCSMCAKMRRGALHNALREHGITKIALGHHFDDAVETLSLIHIFLRDPEHVGAGGDTQPAADTVAALDGDLHVHRSFHPIGCPGGRRAMRPIFPRRSAQRCGRSRPPARWPR